MFDWLDRRDTKKLTTLLASALAGWAESSAFCQRLAGIVDTQAAQLAEARAENQRLWGRLRRSERVAAVHGGRMFRSASERAGTGQAFYNLVFLAESAKHSEPGQ